MSHIDLKLTRTPLVCTDRDVCIAVARYAKMLAASSQNEAGAVSTARILLETPEFSALVDVHELARRFLFVFADIAREPAISYFARCRHCGFPHFPVRDVRDICQSAALACTMHLDLTLADEGDGAPAGLEEQHRYIVRRREGSLTRRLLSTMSLRDLNSGIGIVDLTQRSAFIREETP